MVAAAAGILGAVIQVGKLVAKPIIRQFNYLCCFTININNLKDEAKRLGDATQGLQLQVDRAIDNVQVIVPQVETWLTDSNDINGEVNGILNEATNVESGCLKLAARFSLSKRATKTTARMKELRGKENFDPISQPGPPAAAQIPPGGEKLDFESRRKIEEAIMTTLRGGNVNLIGIYGMGGLGKTTMANRIRNRVLKENVFQEVAMAVVSQQADMSKIQVEIGGSLGLDLTRETSQGRVQKLHDRLSGTKRSLVILDDVWEGLELEDLGIPCDSKGCTILITSRNSDALSAIGCEVKNKFGMEILSEEEAWCLFREGAGTCVDDSKLNPRAKEVVKECKGLPIALKTLGLALKEKDDASIWNNALRELRDGAADISDYIKKVYTPLIMSYNFLDSEMAKSLFLLCCLFPEHSDILLDKLTYFCMGLGIFGGITNVEDARNKMCSLIDTLKSQSLLLDSVLRDRVRMHDVVRDVCIYLAKQKGCIGGNDCTWISSSLRFGERTELRTESRFPNLRLLSLSSQEFEFSSAFLEGIEDLYVLYIESNWRLTSLPHTTHSLNNLKTLLLDWCRKLKTISVVGKLRNLEILICRQCESIEELPLEMKGLNRLKLLELTECGKLKSIGRGIIASLVGLEELKMLGSFNKWEAEDRKERENAALRELEALTNLRCLEIDIEDAALAAENMQLSSKLKKFNIRICPEYALSSRVKLHHKKMSLQLEGESCLGYWIETQLLRETEGLYLSGNGANNVDLAKCQNIKSLELTFYKTMKSIIRTSILVDDAIASDPFPSIEHLLITFSHAVSFGSSLERLGINHNPFCGHEIPSSLFNGLKDIKINKYVGSMSLFTLSMARNLVSLRQLWISNSYEMIKVIEDEQQQQMILLFPKLEILRLMNLSKLVRFCEWKCDVELPSLTTLKIWNCPNMENFSMGFLAAPNLKILQIDEDEIDATKNLNGALQQHYLAHQEKERIRRMKEEGGEEEQQQ